MATRSSLLGPGKVFGLSRFHWQFRLTVLGSSTPVILAAEFLLNCAKLVVLAYILADLVGSKTATVLYFCSMYTKADGPSNWALSSRKLLSCYE